jgi:hypothetical protein
MAILPNPPVEDAAGGEADKSFRLPCLLYETFYLFHRGEAYSSGIKLKN